MNKIFKKLEKTNSFFHNCFVYNRNNYHYIRAVKDEFPHKHLLIDDNSHYVDYGNSNLYEIDERKILHEISKLHKNCHGFTINYIYKNELQYSFRNNNKNDFCGNGCKNTILLNDFIGMIK